MAKPKITLVYHTTLWSGNLHSVAISIPTWTAVSESFWRNIIMPAFLYPLLFWSAFAVNYPTINVKSEQKVICLRVSRSSSAALSQSQLQFLLFKASGKGSYNDFAILSTLRLRQSDEKSPVLVPPVTKVSVASLTLFTLLPT